MIEDTSVSGCFDDGAITWGGRPIARQVVSVGPRQRVILEGSITSVRSRRSPDVVDAPGALLRPSGGTWYEADLDDGSGRIALRWTGRLHVAGVAPGALVRVRGTALSERGRFVVLNPVYELAARPR